MTSDFQRVAEALGLLDDLDHWHAASNIERAFLVVEAMRERDYHFFIEDQELDGEWFWQVGIGRFRGDRYQWVGDGPTAPAAIIAAAAKALESAAKEKPA